MKNVDKGFTVPKWVLINWPKISLMAQNLSAQTVCPSPKVWDFYEKKASLGVRSPCKHTIHYYYVLPEAMNIIRSNDGLSKGTCDDNDK